MQNYYVNPSDYQNKKRVLLATGQETIDNAIQRFPEFECVTRIDYKKEIFEACQMYQPDIIVAAEGLSGYENLPQSLMYLKQQMPEIRIIYLAGYVDIRDRERINGLGLLVVSGIFDIVHEKKINSAHLKYVLKNPKDAEDMAYLTKNLTTKTSNKKEVIDFEENEVIEDAYEDESSVFQNVFVISSIKPGTGKSFLSTNVATAIAAFGMKNKKGQPPKVALIEADLQNLSVGTLLQIEDDKKNLKTVFEEISHVVSDDGKVLNNDILIDKTDKFILSCLKPYPYVRNLEALVGSQLTYQELQGVKASYYLYLINAIADKYDVIIVDSNSSLTHVTTYPILQISKRSYYVVNLDFNNIRNNVRYQTLLNELGVANRVRYVLNEDISSLNNDSTGGNEVEELLFTSEHIDDSSMKLEAKIPIIPKTVFLNRLYEGKPIVLDDNDYTFHARYEILKVANQIWEIEGFDMIEKHFIESQNKEMKKKKGFFK